MNIAMCPQCGKPATYILTLGITITVCVSCCQATLMETNYIIRIDRGKLDNQPYAKKELLMIAYVAKSLYENWDTVFSVSMAER